MTPCWRNEKRHVRPISIRVMARGLTMWSSAWEETRWWQLSMSSFQRTEPYGMTRLYPSLRNRR